MVSSTAALVMVGAQLRKGADTPEVERHAGLRFSPYSLGVRDAATHVGISRTRLEDALAMGHVRAVKAGRRTLVIVESLEQWINSLPTR